MKVDAKEDAIFHFEDLLRSTKALDRHLALVEKRIERLVANLRLKLDVEELMFIENSFFILKFLNIEGTMSIPALILIVHT